MMLAVCVALGCMNGLALIAWQPLAQRMQQEA